MPETREKSKKKSEKVRTGSFMKELLSGSMVTEKIILANLWYVLLLTFLAAIYIGNRFHAEKITRETAKLQSEVKDLRAESLSTSADLMFVSRQSEVYRLVRERGLNLEEMKVPPYKLLVDRK
jgi:cell division protein FtsL